MSRICFSDRIDFYILNFGKHVVNAIELILVFRVTPYPLYNILFVVLNINDLLA